MPVQSHVSGPPPDALDHGQGPPTVSGSCLPPVACLWESFLPHPILISKEEVQETMGLSTTGQPPSSGLDTLHLGDYVHGQQNLLATFIKPDVETLPFSAPQLPPAASAAPPRKCPSSWGGEESTGLSGDKSEGDLRMTSKLWPEALLSSCFTSMSAGQDQTSGRSAKWGWVEGPIPSTHPIRGLSQRMWLLMEGLQT